MKISFIMPAKNTARYIADAVKALLSVNDHDWELIVIDDHSADGTAGVVADTARQDPRVICRLNRGQGKIDALNHGFSLAAGGILKCIDSDDVLDRGFFRLAALHDTYDCVCHGTDITDESLNTLGRYSLNADFLNNGFADCFANLRSLPRCMWSFRRPVAERVFPLPAELPFEDVWFSLVIKRYEYSIFQSDEYPYKYRQHSNQVYGGIYNFSHDKIIFRAKRMKRLIHVLESTPLHDFNRFAPSLARIKCFYRLMSLSPLPLLTLLSAPLAPAQKCKLVIYKKIPGMARALVRLKWHIDTRRHRRNKKS